MVNPEAVRGQTGLLGTERSWGRRKQGLPVGHRGSKTCRRGGKSHESRGSMELSKNGLI